MQMVIRMSFSNYYANFVNRLLTACEMPVNKHSQFGDDLRLTAYLHYKEKQNSQKIYTSRVAVNPTLPFFRINYLIKVCLS